MTDSMHERYDLAVVGAGMAGMATALFAAQRGLRCIQVGNGGGLLFASGLLDLCGVHPVADGRVWKSPFDALAALARDEPGHPLARIDAGAIEAAFAAFVAALGDAGLPYAPPGRVNHGVPTSIGTVKTTFGVPRSMIAGVAALAERPPCLLVDIRGLREFSARQIVAALGDRWPGLRAQRIDFPGTDGAPELYAAHLARALESGEARERTIALVRPLLGDARAVGFPAVLGLRRAAPVHAAFESALGVPVFEIPTMPTSVPGLRLVSALEAAVSARGVHRRHQARVRALSFEPSGDAATLDLADAGSAQCGERVGARAVVLATGRFGGRGLVADRTGVRESLTGLPVQAPASRDGWHRRDFLDSRGHPINRVGLAVDAGWRVLGTDGVPVWPRLYAVGSILCGQDWVRTKCGAGLAIATAWAASGQVAAALGGTGAARG